MIKMISHPSRKNSLANALAKPMVKFRLRFKVQGKLKPQVKKEGEQRYRLVCLRFDFSVGERSQSRARSHKIVVKYYTTQTHCRMQNADPWMPQLNRINRKNSKSGSKNGDFRKIARRKIRISKRVNMRSYK